MISRTCLESDIIVAFVANSDFWNYLKVYCSCVSSWCFHVPSRLLQAMIFGGDWKCE